MSVIKSFTGILSAVILLSSCGASSPVEMAREYCACFKEGQNNPERMAECAELATEHREKLPKNPEAAKIYAEEIIRCAVYEQPEKR